MGIHATREEFFEAIEALSEPERLALAAAANHHASGHSGFACGKDLFNEAVVRVADGSRQWPMDIPVAVFLRNVMRSIASGERGLLHMSPARWKSLSGDELREEDALAAYARPSAEQEALANERRRIGEALLEFVRTKLSADGDGISVLDLWANGYTAAEAREELGMSDARYRATRARVRMRLEQARERGV